VHTQYEGLFKGDQIMNMDILTSVCSTVGGVLLGYALKKIVKLIAVTAGFFVAGLAYPQYQQIASFD
jgi:uncharacterized membrane protein (Fun14 family)